MATDAGAAEQQQAAPASEVAPVTEAAPETKPAPTKLEEYRGAKHWEGLHPGVEEPREWDEGFRCFLLKYGMLNHVVYDTFLRGEEGFKDATGLRGTSRFGTDFAEFTAKGLEFSYMTKHGERKQEYDFTKDYEIVGNLVCSPQAFFPSEDNWFGFIALSKPETTGEKEMLIVFRGTETPKEWAEIATVFMEQLDSDAKTSPFDIGFGRSKLMCHEGFQRLYIKKPANFLSPRETIRDHIKTWAEAGRVEKITVVGHSLGAAMCQHCAIDLAHSKVAGDIPILAIGWAAPRVGNVALAEWVDNQPNLRILRIRNPIDLITNIPPDNRWNLLSSGYKPMGTEINLLNTHLKEEGIVTEKGNSANHNLEMYLHNIDPTRDVALMNKVGNIIPAEYCIKHNISRSWHTQTWPRTMYHK